MQPQNPRPRHTQGLSRRDLLKAGLAAGVTLSAWPRYGPSRSGLGKRDTQARRHPARAWL